MKIINNKMKLFYAVSLVVHLILSLFLTFTKSPQKEITQNEIEFTIEDNKDSQKKVDDINLAKQFVEQPEKAINNEIDDKAKYLSRHNQKVLKQTIAQKRGEFLNSDGKSDIKNKDFTPKKTMDLTKFKPTFNAHEVYDKYEKDQAQKAKEITKKIDLKKALNSESEEQQQQSGGKQASQTLDYIKDLDPGLETLLSSREFTYYTFYSRVRNKLNQFWNPKVLEQLSKIYQQGRKLASSEDKISKLLITLDSNGKVLKVQVVGESGHSELDQAAVEAFREAAPFPNPPKGMIDPDGTIKIRWDFILEA